MELRVKFKFYNVGQGLFYTGKIKLYNDDKIETFNFVYDCGSKDEKLINKAVQAYVKELNGESIDLLILSHLHWDHVSGVPGLLKSVTVKEVVLPYLLPFERLAIAISNHKRAMKKEKILSEEFYLFLEDPNKFLLDRTKGLEQIFFVRNRLDNESATIDIKSRTNLERCKEEFKDITKNESWEEAYLKEKTLITCQGFFRIKTNSATNQHIWTFKFFNKIPDPDLVKAFQNCVSKMLSPAIKINPKGLIRNKNMLEKLSICYCNFGESNRDFNQTSLVVYHGPFKAIKSIYYHYCVPTSTKGLHLCCCPLNHIQIMNQQVSDGHFLTGDFNLNSKQDFQDLICYYLNECTKVLISQVPHHGSSGNWNYQIHNSFKNLNVWIVSSKYTDSSKHPGLSVVLDIINNQKCFIWSNQNNLVVIEGLIKI